MAYRIVELESSDDVDAIRLDTDEHGIALVIRYSGRAVGFGLREFPAGEVVQAETVRDWARSLAGGRTATLSPRQQSQLAADLPEHPSLTIAICTRDRASSLARCLDSVRGLPSAGVDVLVVDNAPSDLGTQRLVEATPAVRYVCEPRPGLNFARNRALREARGTLLAYFDDDVVVDRSWLSGLAVAFGDNADAGALTGLVLPLELRTRAQIVFERRGGFRRGFSRIRYGDSLAGNALYPCGAGIFGAGCNMVFRRELLEELGGFDEALDTGSPLPGGGDLDMFYRVVRAGRALVYEPGMLVFHEHRKEWDALKRQYWSWGLGFFAFVAKSFGADPPMRGRFVRLGFWWFNYQFRMLCRSFINSDPMPPSLVLAEIRGGISGLFGGYARSRRRIHAIRRSFRSHPDGSAERSG